MLGRAESPGVGRGVIEETSPSHRNRRRSELPLGHASFQVLDYDNIVKWFTSTHAYMLTHKIKMKFYKPILTVNSV